MTYYAQILKDKVVSASINGKTISDDIQNIEIAKDIYSNIQEYGNDYYLYGNGEFVLNPDYPNVLAENEKRIRIAEIKLELETIDKQKIRAITETEIKDETTGETWLDHYNNKAKGLREELHELESILLKNESEGRNE